MKFKTLDDFNFKGKKVLLRADLNSPVYRGKVLMNDRFLASVETIKELKRKGASVVVLAHQSQKGKNDFISLRQHAKFLNKFVKVEFVPDIIGRRTVKEIIDLKKGGVLLLENVRFEESEFSPSKNNPLVRVLSTHFDIFINDAFSVSHRNQTSLVSFAGILPSGAGRTMQREIENLSKVRRMKNCLYILGGAKADVNIPLMRKAKRVLVGGLFGLMCMRAKGFDFGVSNKLLDSRLKNVGKIRKNFISPIDFAVSIRGVRKELDLDDFPSKYEVFDIGSKTAEFYSREMMKARCVFMKGPVGMYEDKEFRKGTSVVLKAIASSKAFSVLGGGHLNDALKESGISKKKFDYISLAGGATAEFLAGKKLPGLEALEKK